jgi:hypothetical protein
MTLTNSNTMTYNAAPLKKKLLPQEESFKSGSSITTIQLFTRFRKSS